MEKRVLLAVILSFIVLYGYQALFPPRLPEQRQAPTTPEQQPGVESPATTSPAATPEAAPAPEPAPVEALVADEAERDIIVENEYVRGVFSSRGAVLKSWRLKRYGDDEGQPLELVPANVPAGALRPFALAVDDSAITGRLQRALYRPSATDLRVEDESALEFEYQDGDGLAVRKVFRFSAAEPYVIRFSAEVTHAGQPLVPAVHWGPALGDGLSEESSFLYSPPAQPIFYRDGDVTRVGGGDVAQYATQEGAFGFAGVDDHYFISATLPEAQPLQLRYQPLHVPGATPDDRVARFVEWSVRFPAAPSDALFFFGPKDFEVLASVDRDFVRAIHFGIFSPIVVPLLRSLNWIHGYVGNYGWSIIILTAIINIMMFPLRHKSVVSMRKMQEIQPEVKAIQERYSKLKVTDPARSKMNAEMMNLYRERGVNPASGCVPMLLTLPVLISFYSMLSVAIELRGAPFIGWITDLSRHDPWFITPVLMGATQFVQTKMTPSTADPTQQKVMLLMPLMFMAFFLWAPSGLVLYWTVANMWAIGQQALTNKIIGPMPQRTVRPPAERKLKNAGGGRTAQAAKERK
ncbi:MAG: membrane protein insertase YidC [Acidobacteria bacterium]|nr:membrane protein insertase YidC [Acidobacteriota bacterium]